MAGLYLHIPFCERKCVYCDFYSIENMNPMEGFLNALGREIHLAPGSFAGDRFSTVFFGGGTPSLLTPVQLTDIMSDIRDRFLIEDNAEITLESNPGTIDGEKLQAYREYDFKTVSAYAKKVAGV